jgi:alkyldihydroxyacetonephosphate synthase
MSAAFLTAVRATLPSAVRTTREGPIIEPHGTSEVALVVRLALEHGAHLVPPGAPREAYDEAVPLDLHRMARLIAYDEVSHLAHAEAGISLAALGDDMRRRGRALPMRRELPADALGTWLARGAPGARCHDDDPVEQLVAGLTAVLPDGRVLELRPAPRRAVGPDLVSALIGAEGRLGIITAVHILTRPRRPMHELYFLFPSRLDAEAARAHLRGRGVRPELAEVCDAPEGSALLLSLSGEGALLEAAIDVVRDSAKARRGAEVSARDVPPLAAPTSPPASEVVAALAARLDPSAVLSPRPAPNAP